jgi:hypothetical protein
MWDKLTPADIHNARQQLGRRREEMLRRHAEELAAVDADNTEIETLQRLVSRFVEKFNVAAATAASETATAVPQENAAVIRFDGTRLSA